MKTLTQAELKRQLHYDPETGIFMWKISPNNSVRAGLISGSVGRRGYIQMRLFGKNYLAHRLAWLYIYGYFPEHYIDHKNGVLSDNRIENLRHVTHACNLQNKKVDQRNTSGFTGVCLDKRNNVWQAFISVHNTRPNLGSYNDPLEAALARYTCEVWHEKWTCNHRSKLTQAIKAAWPEFNPTP